MAQVAAAHPWNTYVGWWLPDGTAAGPGPVITGFSASLSPVNSSSARLVLQASAQNAQSFTFSAGNAAVSGLTSVTTSGGTAQDSVTLPVNDGAEEATYTFAVAVFGPGGTAEASTTVEELAGSFSGTGRVQVLFYSPGDQNWFLGSISKTGTLSWKKADSSAGFGDTAQDPTWVI
jgi:hypothetical protein